jgi:probable HAF family extracellular repeat protein
VPGLAAAVPDGINNAGQIVGLIATGTTDRGFIYTPGVGTTTLGTFGTSTSNRSEVTAINDNGVAAGWADVDLSKGTKHAFIYANGTMTDLGTLGGVQNQSQAFAINFLGHVAGESFDKLNISNAFLYKPGVGMTALGGVGILTNVLGMNDEDQIVGYGVSPSDGSDHAFIYNPGSGLSTLDPLIPPNSGWTLQEATAINDTGQIVGFGTNPQGNTGAFLLTPLPEPASGAFVLLSAGALLRLRRPRATRSSETC